MFSDLDHDEKYDWRKPITVANPENKSGVSKEGKSFEWFKYWLKNNCSLREVSRHFKISYNTVTRYSLRFFWKERREARQTYYSTKQELKDEERYRQFQDETYQETTNEKKLLENVIAFAGMYAGIIPNKENKELVDFEQFQDAAKIIISSAKSLNLTRKSQLRSMNQPEKINDKTLLKGTIEYKGVPTLEASFEKEE